LITKRSELEKENMPPNTDQQRLMVVDDERDIAQIFKSGLERNGFLVDIFDEPLDALSHFKPNFYDLLLLDVRMPRMSGFELFNEILKVDPAAKACFITAFEIHAKEFRENFMGGAEECIIKKPILLKELVTRINKEIGG